MKVAYIDTSVLIGIIFKEQKYKQQNNKLGKFDEVLSSDLLVAELLTTLKRENYPLNQAGRILNSISIVIPERTLTKEIEIILSRTYCKGADCFHLASALFLDPHAKDLVFITNDIQQRKAAIDLGFQVV